MRSSRPPYHEKNDCFPKQTRKSSSEIHYNRGSLPCQITKRKGRITMENSAIKATLCQLKDVSNHLRYAAGNLEVLHAAVSRNEMTPECFADGLCFTCIGLWELCGRLRLLVDRGCEEAAES